VGRAQKPVDRLRLYLRFAAPAAPTPDMSGRRASVVGRRPKDAPVAAHAQRTGQRVPGAPKAASMTASARSGRRPLDGNGSAGGPCPSSEAAQDSAAGNCAMNWSRSTRRTSPPLGGKAPHHRRFVGGVQKIGGQQRLRIAMTTSQSPKAVQPDVLEMSAPRRWGVRRCPENTPAGISSTRWATGPVASRASVEPGLLGLHRHPWGSLSPRPPRLPS
jgi:hypothetical protein